MKHALELWSLLFPRNQKVFFSPKPMKSVGQTNDKGEFTDTELVVP